MTTLPARGCRTENVDKMVLCHQPLCCYGFYFMFMKAIIKKEKRKGKRKEREKKERKKERKKKRERERKKGERKRKGKGKRRKGQQEIYQSSLIYT
jgi:hypothetical protein